MRYLRFLLIVLALNSLVAFAQEQQIIYNQSIKAYENKDYKSFLKYTQKLDSIRPFHPTYTYNLASAYALNNKADKAVATLKKMVLMNNTVAFETDSDFTYIKDTEGFKSVLALKEAQNKLIETSKQVVILSEKELHPEGLVYLPKSKTWLASSIRKRKIVSFDIKTGQCTDWFKNDNTLAVLALKPDAKEKYLWVATAAFAEMENYDRKLEGKAAILKIDIQTKQMVKTFAVDGNHIFGDLIVAKNGVVYVSDSDKPIVYKIENDVMSEFVSFESDGFNLQGLAFNDKQNKLFIADYLKGIAILDRLTKTKTWLSFPNDSSAKGIDGLVFYNNTLITIQNGVKPIRITQFQLNEQQNQIIGFKILDNTRPEFNEPALATSVEDKLYFFANSPWNAYDKNKVLDADKFNNPKLYSCKLSD
jgi:sugar lactone lactonase YvrE